MNTEENILTALKEEVSMILSEKKEHLNKYDINALSFIINYLDELRNEYQANKFKSKTKRFGHLARIIIDRDTSLINSNLGKRLIEAEQKYIHHS